MALLFAVEIGFQSIVVEDDSLFVIKKQKSRIEDGLLLRVIIYKIRRLKLRVEEISYQFVRREANMAAHILAKEGQWSNPQFLGRRSSSSVQERGRSRLAQMVSTGSRSG